MILSDCIEGGTAKLEHENKKLRWSILPNGNYLFANRSPVRPIKYEFSPKARVREIETNTRLGDFVYVSSINGSRFTFNIVDKVI